ncbi:hypothetical protein FB45DRAFT_894496 [Roridomyces roridus]|uniref:Uncharacterized protein n=1 Tax=Roridomyces roridus TaxID=1738132 RepID=A0AAD7CI75_9AGAR|nr:hypothetical protein FB45DRAFT_894496 [Roridomyces roridus]
MQTAETVTTMVSLLGGPTIDAEEIHGATELSSGQRLLEWLVCQVHTDDNTNAPNSIRAALQAVSLESEELQKLRQLATRRTAPVRDGEDTELALPSGYIPPWRLRPNEQYIGAEAALHEADTGVLKARLQQTKLASQKLSQAIKAIASEIEKVDKDIRTSEERLSELSIHADTAILASVDSSLERLAQLTSENDECLDEEALSAVSSINTTLIDHFESQMRAIDASSRRLPTPSEIKAECARLDAVFNTPRAGEKGHATMFDAVFNRELGRLCRALDDPETTESAIAEIFADGDLEPSAPSPATIDVRSQLEHAWAQDQAALLEARGAVLEQAIASFSDNLIPSLTVVHDDLAAADSGMREVQALVEALREETQDIVVTTEERQENTKKLPDARDAELEADLESLLKRLQDLRPPDAPPLVLSNREDIIDELRAVYEREQGLRQREENWAANLLPTLRGLEAAHGPLLSEAYRHSPMNTSLPFACPPDVRAVQVNAKAKSDDLKSAIDKLQEEMKTLESDRAKKRLEHFIGKWVK